MLLSSSSRIKAHRRRVHYIRDDGVCAAPSSVVATTFGAKIERPQLLRVHFVRHTYTHTVARGGLLVVNSLLYGAVGSCKENHFFN